MSEPATNPIPGGGAAPNPSPSVPVAVPEKVEAAVREELALMLGWALDYIHDVGETPLPDVEDGVEEVARAKWERATKAMADYRAALSVMGSGKVEVDRIEEIAQGYDERAREADAEAIRADEADDGTAHFSYRAAAMNREMAQSLRAVLEQEGVRASERA